MNVFKAKVDEYSIIQSILFKLVIFILFFFGGGGQLGFLPDLFSPVIFKSKYCPC